MNAPSAKWARIEYVDEKQVLITNTFNADDDQYQIAFEIRAADFVPGCAASMVKLKLGRSSEPFAEEKLDLPTVEMLSNMIHETLVPAIKEAGVE